MRATVCTVRKAGDLCVHARQYACVGVYTRTELARTHHPTPPTMSGTLYDCAVGVVSDAPKRPSRCVADLHRGPSGASASARNRCFVLSCYRDSQVLTKWHGAISWTFLVVKLDTASPNRPPNPDPGIFHRSLSWEVRAKELWRQGFRGGALSAETRFCSLPPVVVKKRCVCRV